MAFSILRCSRAARSRGGVVGLFVLAPAAFVTPVLLGGGRVAMVAQNIEQQERQFLDWPLAAALAVVLTACALTFQAGLGDLGDPGPFRRVGALGSAAGLRRSTAARQDGGAGKSLQNHIQLHTVSDGNARSGNVGKDQAFAKGTIGVRA